MAQEYGCPVSDSRDMPGRDRIVSAVVRRHERVSSEQTRRGPVESQEYPGEFGELVATAINLKLKGRQLKCVQYLAKAGGSLRFADLKLKLNVSWEHAGPWNNLRQRLNKKLRRRGWGFWTIDGCATVKRNKVAG